MSECSIATLDPDLLNRKVFEREHKMTPQFDVFLSHSSIDKPWVIKLKDDLIRYGVSVWLDKDEIRPGDLFGKALEQALDISKAVALIVSPEAINSGWVEEEYYRALSLAKDKRTSAQIIPVILRDANLPGFLTNRNWVDFRDETTYAQSVWKLVWGIMGEKPPEVYDLEPLTVSIPSSTHSKMQTVSTIDNTTISGGLNEKSVVDIYSPKSNIDRLTIEKKIKDFHIDRDEEIKLFRNILEGQSNVRILLIEAESGMGKTALLEKYEKMSKTLKLPWAKVDFKNASYTFGEIIREMCDQLREISFLDFEDQCRNFITNSGLTVGRSALLSSSIDAALSKLSPDDRKMQRQVIIDAFFGALISSHERFHSSIVLSFDTFEKASSNVKEWITQQFITRSKLYSWIICVVAGQETPGIDPTTEWCSHSKLERLSKEHIAEYLHHLKLTQEDVIVKFITSVLGRDSSELKSVGEDVLLELFTGILALTTSGKPADLQQIALRLATQDR